MGARSQIDLRQSNGGAWNELAGSASGLGLSNSSGHASAPSLAYDNGTLFAAWQDDAGGADQVDAVTFTDGVWKAAGSLAGGSTGVSHSPGDATSPQLAANGGRLYLAWLDDEFPTLPGDAVAVYSTLWNGAAFVEQLPGDARAGGIDDRLGSPQAPALAVDAAGHPFVSWTDASSGRPQIDVLGNTFDLGTIHYVNDASTAGDSFSTAPGQDTNDGLTPGTPKGTIQAVLNDQAHPLHAGDVILIDSGVYAGPVDLSSVPAGVLILGSTGAPTTISGLVTGTGFSGVTLSDLTLSGGVTFTDASQVTLSDDIVSGTGITLTGGSGIQVVHDAIAVSGTGITLGGGVAVVTIEHNVITAGAMGIAVVGESSGLEIRDNRIGGEGTGIELAVPASGQIVGNAITAATIGIAIDAPFAGSIGSNDIRNANAGVNYNAGAALANNRIHDDATGIVSTVADTVNGLGFVAGGSPDQVFDNATGVHLTGVMQDEHVFDNAIGVTGSGSLVASDLDHANVFEANGVGIEFDGPIEFDRITRGAVGILAIDGQLIAHNLIYGTTQAGIDVEGRTDVRIVNNTLDSAVGDLVNIAGGSADVQLLNNIFWAGGGYDINVSNDSQQGFFSDYNDLYADGAGKLVHWDIDFDDILDWQADVALYDLHSIGRTVVNPTWAEPRFLDASLDDFRVYDLVVGQRFSSPSIDAGDPITDLAGPSTDQNLLIDPGFEQGLGGWNTNPSATTRASTPAPFEGSQYFFAGGTPSGFAEQTVNLVADGISAGQIDGPGLFAVFGGRVRSAAESPPAQGLITLTFLDASHTEISQDTVKAQNVNDRWELVGDRLAIPVGTRFLEYRFEADRQTGTNDNSFLDGAFLRVEASAVAPDQGAYGNALSELSQSTTAHIALRFPDLYTDWEEDVPHTILWNTYNNPGHASIRIDLYQDGPNGPAFLANITPSTADTGEFSWTPSTSGIGYGTHGLHIQVSLVGQPAVFDRSTEPFAVPENTNTFYVNDASTVNDDLAFGTAVGSNRNTGKTPDAPKPYPNNILRTYKLGPGQTLYVNTGDYELLAPIVLSNTLGIGDDAGFTFIGPSDPTEQVVFQLADPLIVAPVIELNNASFMTIAHLTLMGGQIGLWVHNNSTNLNASYLTATGMSQQGFRIDAGSDGATLSHLVATADGLDGIDVTGNVLGLDHSLASGNAGSGIVLTNTGSAPIVGDVSAANGGYGIVAIDTNGVPMVIGDPSLATDGDDDDRGNLVYDNVASGIYASGNVQVAGNSVFGQVRRARPGSCSTVPPRSTTTCTTTTRASSPQAAPRSMGTASTTIPSGESTSITPASSSITSSTATRSASRETHSAITPRP